MNPEEIRRKLREAINRLDELRSADGLTTEQAEEATNLLVNVQELRTQLDTANQAETAISEFRAAETTSRGRISAGDSVADAELETRSEEYRSAGQLLTESDEYRAWADANNRRGSFNFTYEGDEARTLANTALLPSEYVQPQRLSGFRRESDTYGSLRDVLLVGQTNSESLLWFEEDVFTNNAAFVSEATATTGSSGLKPESAITFTQKTSTVGTIAHWLPITNQLEWVAPELRSYIDGRLLDGLQLEEDLQLLAGTGVAPDPFGLLETVGIQDLNDAYFITNPTQNAGTEAEPFDRIARAKRLITDVGRARANFIVVNPEDEEYFQTIMDANGHYYGGGPYSAGVATTFWGLRRVVNENMPAGQALVGDGRQAQIWDRMSARIEVGLINDQFIRNIKTILAEKRVGLTVYRPKAFAVVDLFA